MSAIYGDNKPGRVNKSAFNLSHERVLTCNMGQLVPVFNEFCYPNEDWKVSNSCVIRFNPLIHPIMHEVNATIHYFAVPMRLLYPKFDINGATTFCFEDTITGGQDGTGLDMASNFQDIKPNLAVSSGWSGGIRIGSSAVTLPNSPGGSAVTGNTLKVGMANPWFKRGSLWDYFRNAPAIGIENAGVTAQSALEVNLTDETKPIDACWRAYHFIWWEYYRDEIIREQSVIQGNASLIWYPSLMQSVGATTYGGSDVSQTMLYIKPSPNNTEVFTNPLFDPCVAEPKYRAYEKDYFTAAQVQAQRGTPGVVTLQSNIMGSDAFVIAANPALDIPLSVAMFQQSSSGALTTLSPAVDGIANQTAQASSTFSNLTRSNGSPMSAVGQWAIQPSNVLPNGGAGLIPPVGLGNNTPLMVRGAVLQSGAPLFDINQLRLANAMQAFAEVQQRFGTRLTEWIYGVFGEAAQDSRLQRPEYLGGTKFPVVFSEVLQTSETSDSSALGDLGGHGMSVNGDFAFSYHTNEHCVILGLLSVMPRASYGQGVDRQFMFNNRYDFYNPAFAFIGEQGIYAAEIYAYGDEPSEIFGYQAAFDQYRQRTNSYHGLMHTDLDTWHLGRKFSSTPQLNTDFITSSTDDFKRAFAATEEVELQVAIGHRVTAIRPMPWNSVPHIDGLEDLRSGGM